MSKYGQQYDAGYLDGLKSLYRTLMNMIYSDEECESITEDELQEAYRQLRKQHEEAE
jgi:hypothetical protein